MFLRVLTAPCGLELDLEFCVRAPGDEDSCVSLHFLKKIHSIN